MVTSRHRLEPLVAADGARLLTLDPLGPEEARDLLARRVGAHRVAAEPGAVAEIVARCAGLPLALAVVAGRAVARPGYRLADHAADLRSASRLDALRGGDAATDVRTVLSWSLDALTPDAAHLFRRLGLHPGPTVTTAAAASLLGRPVPPVRTLLAELVDGSLVAEPAPAGSSSTTACTPSPGKKRRDRSTRPGASTRSAGSSTTTCAPRTTRPRPSARGATAPPRHRPFPVSSRTTSPTGQPRRPGSADRGPVLVAVLRQAAGAGLDVHLWQLAWTLAPVLDSHGRWTDSVAVQHAGVGRAAARPRGPRPVPDRRRRGRRHPGVQRGRLVRRPHRRPRPRAGARPAGARPRPPHRPADPAGPRARQPRPDPPRPPPAGQRGPVPPAGARAGSPSWATATTTRRRGSTWPTSTDATTRRPTRRCVRHWPPGGTRPRGRPPGRGRGTDQRPTGPSLRG